MATNRSAPSPSVADASSVTEARSVAGPASSVTEASSVADAGTPYYPAGAVAVTSGRPKLPDDHPQVLGASAPPPDREAYRPAPQDKTLLADVVRKGREKRRQDAEAHKASRSKTDTQ